MIFKSLKSAPFFFASVSTVLALCLSPATQAQAQGQAQPVPAFVIVSGKASYLQRIAMPPEAVLTVQVQEVSRADARATVLAESREVFGQRQVPLAYSVKVARSAINPRLRYAVRATISVGGQTQFSTTRQYPVLTHGAPNQHDLLLAAVPSVVPAPAALENMPSGMAPSVLPHMPPSRLPSPSTAAPAALNIALPATFAGVLPCADCMGIAHTLTLQPDGGYRLRRTYLGKPVEPMTEAGHWTSEHNGKRLALHSAGNERHPVFFSVRVDGALRQLDGSGQAIKTSLNMDLRRTAQLDAVHKAAAMHAGAHQTPVDAGAAFGLAPATLQDTYWKLVELNGQPVALLPGQEREVRLTLSSQDARLMGFSGCNVLAGSYAQNGASLKFDQLASSMRMCEPALNALERQVLDALVVTTGQRINGQRLSLLAGNRVLARFEAVYLK